MSLRPPHQRTVGWCSGHGKDLYPTRAAAKKSFKSRGDSGRRAYPCELVPGHWHYGRLPPAVRYGLKTCAEVYQ